MSGADLQITFLGTGSTIPPNGRQQVSFAIRQATGLILFDCGEGTQYSLRKYKVSIRREIVICISHLHADHFLGLPGLLSSLELLDREETVKIVGPEGINLTVENLLKANYIAVTYPVEIHEMVPGSVFESEGYQITAIRAIHEANALSFIYREDDFPGKVNMERIQELGIPQGPLIGELQSGKEIEISGKKILPRDILGEDRPGRVVVYSGDTSFNRNLINAIPENCDLLVHEGTYPFGRDDLAKERSHSTIKDAAIVAQQAKVKQLIITHLSPRIDNLDQQLRKAREIFPKTDLASEGMTFSIPYPY